MAISGLFAAFWYITIIRSQIIFAVSTGPLALVRIGLCMRGRVIQLTFYSGPRRLPGMVANKVTALLVLFLRCLRFL